MSFQKLLLSAAAAFLMIGASGAAHADIDCSGYLSGVINDDVSITEGNTCIIQDAVVLGEVIATDAGDVSVLKSQVSGNIHLDDSRVALVALSSARNIRTRRNEVAIVLGSLANRNIIVNRNVLASVQQNGAVVSIICRANGELDESRNNSEGDEECGEAGNL